jgi:tetratricopeptide (TPR) repeat protein
MTGGRRLATGTAIALLVVLVGAITGWLTWRRASAVARLPAPPPSASITPAVSDHVGAAFAAAERDPRSIAAVGPLCLAYHADMLFDEASRCYDVIVELDPRTWRWHYLRALLDAERGGSPELAGRLRRVIELAPDFGPAWLRLGDAEFKASRYDAAAEAWRRARDRPDPPAPSETPAHRVEVPLRAFAVLGLARVALVKGDAAGAVSLLQPLAAEVPRFSAALRLLAEGLRATGREADGAQAVSLAGRLPPFAPYSDPVMDALARESRNATLLLRVASEADLAVNLEWSEHLTRRALEFEPDNPEAIAKMARLHRAAGRNEQALSLFERYHRMVPGDFQVLAQIATTLSALGRFEEAEGYFQQALRGVDDAVTHFNLGLLMARTGRLDQAVTAYQRALEREPTLSDARTNLATVFARQGRLDRAAQELQRVLALDPDNPLARANLDIVRDMQAAR